MDYPRYDPASPVTPLAADEIDALDRLLQALPVDGAMTIDAVDGFLTALLVGPSRRLADAPTAAWLPAVWGGDGPDGPAAAAPFASKRRRKDAVVLLLRHLRHLDHLLDQAPDDWEPVFGVAEHGPDEFVDARDWCAGFLAAVDLDPTPWRPLWDDPGCAPLLRLGGGVDDDDDGGDGDGDGEAPDDHDADAAGDDGDDLDDPALVDALSRSVPDAVLAIRARAAAAR